MTVAKQLWGSIYYIKSIIAGKNQYLVYILKKIKQWNHLLKEFTKLSSHLYNIIAILSYYYLIFYYKYLKLSFSVNTPILKLGKILHNWSVIKHSTF